MPKNYPTALNVFLNAGGWVIGSAADPAVEKPRDWDVVIPFSLWPGVCSAIPRTARPNSFGGWKFDSEGVEIDVWPDDLNRVLVDVVGPRRGWLWHPKSSLRFRVGN